ncbi:MAG: HAMP domain-containing histidine kinase [Chloroflexota bacterium]|nr:HAMP domain-containing histidine kinase [Chloroflexota bacterium]
MLPADPAARPPRRRGLLRRLQWTIPLGWQLSALYTILLIITLTLVGLGVYAQQDGFLVQDTADRLAQGALRVAAAAQLPPGLADHGRGLPGDGRGRGGPGDSSEPLRLRELLIRGLSGPGVSVAVLDGQGTVLTTTQGLVLSSAPTVALPTAAQIAAVRAGGTAIHWVVRGADDIRQVVVLQPLTQVETDVSDGAPPTGTPLLIEQAASLAATDAALGQLGLYLLLGVLGGTLAGLVLGRVFTQALLRPLDRVADTAEAIAGGDLGRRLQLPPGRNEVARLGQTFDHMVGRLVATLEAQRRFVADASHELRTPLTSLKGLAEILVIGAHGNNPQVIEQSAGAIRSELERLSRLVNDLLTLSRLDSAGDSADLPVRHTRTDVCATLAAAVTQMGPLAEAHAVRLEQACGGPLWVMGDAGQLKQVVLNLLDNALRYTPPGGAVTVRAAVAESWACLTVQDTGSGIAANDLPHIFARFYRGDPSRTRATGNSGLGLAIVRALIEAHGGTIGVQSTSGAGTCFVIRLPLAPALRPLTANAV